MADFTAVKNAKGKYVFTCSCGSEMWDNRAKKTNPKGPDFKCKNVDCKLGKGGTPKAVWLTPEQKAEYSGASAYQKVSPSSEPVASQYVAEPVERVSSAKSVDTDMKVSFYGAWAKDMALYIAKENSVKTCAELKKIYADCLSLIGSSLKSHCNVVDTCEKVESTPVKVTPQPVKQAPAQETGDIDLSGLDDVEI